MSNHVKESRFLGLQDFALLKFNPGPVLGGKDKSDVR